MRWIRNILLVILVFAGLWWLLGKLNVLPSLGRIFSQKDVTIDQTPVLVQQVRPLAQLVTITAYTEVTADTTARASTSERIRDIFNPFSFEVNMNRRLIVTGGAVVHVGVDLQKLEKRNFNVRNDSIFVQLPAAEILEVIVNPSSTAIFLEEGQWNNEAVTNLKQRIQIKAREEVYNRGLLFQAEERAREVLTDFFLAARFKYVSIQKGRLG